MITHKTAKASSTRILNLESKLGFCFYFYFAVSLLITINLIVTTSASAAPKADDYFSPDQLTQVEPIKIELRSLDLKTSVDFFNYYGQIYIPGTTFSLLRKSYLRIYPSVEAELGLKVFEDFYTNSTSLISRENLRQFLSIHGEPPIGPKAIAFYQWINVLIEEQHPGRELKVAMTPLQKTTKTPTEIDFSNNQTNKIMKTEPTDDRPHIESYFDVDQAPQWHIASVTIPTNAGDKTYHFFSNNLFLIIPSEIMPKLVATYFDSVQIQLEPGASNLLREFANLIAKEKLPVSISDLRRSAASWHGGQASFMLHFIEWLNFNGYTYQDRDTKLDLLSGTSFSYHTRIRIQELQASLLPLHTPSPYYLKADSTEYFHDQHLPNVTQLPLSIFVTAKRREEVPLFSYRKKVMIPSQLLPVLLEGFLNTYDVRPSLDKTFRFDVLANVLATKKILLSRLTIQTASAYWSQDERKFVSTFLEWLSYKIRHANLKECEIEESTFYPAQIEQVSALAKAIASPISSNSLRKHEPNRLDDIEFVGPNLKAPPKTEASDKGKKNEKDTTSTSYLKSNAIDSAKKILDAGGEPAKLLNEFIFASWTMDTSDSKRVTLLLGNESDDEKEKPTEQELDEVAEFIESLVSKGFGILFDADSNYAEVISESAGKSAVAITGREKETYKKDLDPDTILISITNPYLRMRVFGKDYGPIVVDTTSVSGIGQLIEGTPRYILDQHDRLSSSSDLAGFRSDRYQGRRPTIYSSWQALAKTIESTKSSFRSYLRDDPPKSVKPKKKRKRKGTPAEAPPPAKNADIKKSPSLTTNDTVKQYSLPNIDTLLKLADSRYDLKDGIQHVETLISGQKFMSYENGAKEKPIPGGSVVFGSSRVMREYFDLVYNSILAVGEVGIPVATGGAEGFMRVANEAAWAAGVHSIGIPLGFGASLKSERHTASDVHTLTVSTPGYESRIPLLLYNRRLVIAAPGTGGTYKEIATAFSALSLTENSEVDVILLGFPYYANLYALLNTFGIPEHLKSRIHFIKSPEEMAALVESINTKVGNHFSQLRTAQKPTPRMTPKRLSDEQRPHCEDSFGNWGKIDLDNDPNLWREDDDEFLTRD